MAFDRAMSADDKLLFVSMQMDALQRESEANALQCPYCGKVTTAGDTLCCRTMAAAVTVLLDARDKVKAMQRGLHK